MSLDMFYCLLVYGNLNRICILLLCENHINLNYELNWLNWFIMLFRSTITLYFSGYSFYLSFESLVLKLQLKILIKLREKITVIYSGTICNLVLDFPSFLDVAVAQTVKNLPAMQETRVRYLGWEDPLEVEMAIHSSIFSPRESHGQRSLAGASHSVAKCWTQLSN